MTVEELNQFEEKYRQGGKAGIAAKAVEDYELSEIVEQSRFGEILPLLKTRGVYVAFVLGYKAGLAAAQKNDSRH